MHNDKLVRAFLIAVLLPVSAIAIFAGLSLLEIQKLSHTVTRYAQIDLLLFLILFCLSWAWNGWNEFMLLKNYIEELAQERGFWYGVYIALTSFCFSIMLMILLIVMFAFLWNLYYVLVAAALYTLVDIISWLVRKRQLHSSSISKVEAFDKYYIHTPHICRLVPQILISVAILLTFYYNYENLLGSDYIALFYIVFLFCMIYSEAVIQYWRMNMKEHLLMKLRQEEMPEKHLLFIMKTDLIFKATLYILYLFTFVAGAIWTAGFVTENFFVVFKIVYEFDGRRGIVAASLFFGVLAYSIKLWYRLWYGMCEILIGMFIINDSVLLQWEAVGVSGAIKIAGGIL
jgi:hypothetical protein